MVTKDTKTLGESLKELEEISTWFEEQDEIDVEKGIMKAKEGAALLASTRKQLAAVENEFEEVKKSLEK